MKRIFLFDEMKDYFLYFIKWLIISVLIGCVCGFIGVGFFYSIEYATKFRKENPIILYFLPLIGFLIVFIYKSTGMETDGGTNTIFTSVREYKVPKLVMAPLIFLSSVLTHVGGGSAGREGAALQIGGSLAANFGKFMKFRKDELKIATVCGMSAVFSAVFGTPVTSAIFCIEVVNVGLFHFTALFPCITASFSAHLIAKSCGIKFIRHKIDYIPNMDIEIILKVMVLAAGCALISIIFCRSMSLGLILYKKFFKNSYSRILVSSVIIVVATLLLGTDDYLGMGHEVINKALMGHADTFAFVIKIILTVVTLTAGFKGGEIVPSMFIGATFGCVLGDLIGLNPAFAAALGLIGVLCGSVNCPISSLLMGIEMFNGQYISYFAIVCTVSYYFSGRFSLYRAQKIVYPKINLEN